MIPSQNRIEISVKGATSVLVGVKGLIMLPPSVTGEVYCLHHYQLIILFERSLRAATFGN